jgi:hypothetical protein
VDLGTDLSSDRVEALLLGFVRGHQGVETRDPHTPYTVVEKITGASADLRTFIWTDSEGYRRGTLELKSALLKGSKALLVAEGYVVTALQ